MLLSPRLKLQPGDFFESVGIVVEYPLHQVREEFAFSAARKIGMGGQDPLQQRGAAAEHSADENGLMGRARYSREPFFAALRPDSAEQRFGVLRVVGRHRIALDRVGSREVFPG